MNRTVRHIACALVAAYASAVLATAEAPDQRASLDMSASEKSVFLSEMRQMLTSIQGIIAGIGHEDRALIVESARRSGNRMARDMPPALRARLPAAFKDIGGPTHMMFEELVVRAQTDDMATLADFTGQLMRQCLACHDKFKVD